MAKPNILKLLAEADKRNGFPAGTMQSIMQQETGGNTKYLDDPTAYHYAANAQGKRIAGHSGKVSTAFGPFGILESTGAKPGYGVAPLKDKSLEEQVRFASEYLAGRSKQAGSLEAGLAGYGEGGGYSKQVIARRDGKKPASILSAPDDQVSRLAQAPGAAPVVLAQAPVQQLPQGAAMMDAPAAMPPPQMQAAGLSHNNPWAALGQAMPAETGMRPADLDFAGAVGAPPAVQMAMARGPAGMLGMDEAASAEKMHSVLKRFGLGRYSQESDRYQATVPEFTRPA